MEKQIKLSIEPSLLARFFSQILSKGVSCRACLPSPLKELLCQQIGLPSDYVENRVQTIFLNGKPVDDMEQAMAVAGDTIALSAAMPGLLGAVLRKGGYYSAMRRDITYERECPASGSQEGMVLVKLFNLTVREVGPILLQHGIWIEPAEFEDLLGTGLDEWQSACREVMLDGQKTDLSGLPQKLSSNDRLFLQVNS